MPSKKISLIFSAFLLLTISLFSFIKDDDDILQKAAAQLYKWSTDHPIEKVYLHTDKPYYAIGDDIWFKAYVTLGGKHLLSAVSGVLNVELINPKDSVTKAIKLPITAGVAWGDFKLPDSLSEGNYRIRAYTNWMRNDDDAYFFDKTIQVGNAISNNVFTKTSYTFDTEKDQQKVTAEITYTNLQGAPYESKEVSYDVIVNNKRITGGKGITDSEGNLSIAFNDNPRTPFKKGDIATTIKLSPTEKVTKVLPVKAVSQKTDVQFLPEGGTFLSGVRNKVAFKAVGTDGLSVEVKGTVVDNDDHTIATIASQHLGMGVFVITPEAEKTYTAKLTYPDGSEGEIALPKVTGLGYALGVNSVYDSATVMVKIATNQATLQANQNSEINLMVQAGGDVIYTAKTKLTSPVFVAKIPKSRFPSGIAQFTLFSATGEVLNERVAMIEGLDQLNITLSTAKQTYAPREKVKLDITAQSKDAKPIVGAFSVAVTNESKVPVDEANETTILSTLLLTSDIKGYIEKPNYYFTNVNDKTRADLDLLMLTQGYRRFVWKQMMADTYAPLAFKAEKSMDISGHVKTFGGKPVAKAKVTLLTTSGSVLVLDTVTDETGAFTFDGLVIRDSAKFVVQARNPKGGKNVDIFIDNTASPIITTSKNAADVEVNVNNTLLPYLQNSKDQYEDFLKYGLVQKTMMLNTVTITEKRASRLKNSANYNGPGNADQTLMAEDLENCVMLSDCLMGKVHFVNFRQGKAYSMRSPNNPMLIILDGMPMVDFDLDDIPSSAVSSIEVLRSLSYLAIYGPQAANGALVITTKRGGDYQTYQSYVPGILGYHPKGYYQARQFYAPRYDDPKTNARIADLRSTIYWNPNIITGKDGQASVSFFNADGKSTYKAVIEGIDADGNIGRQVFRYKVE